MQVNKQEAIYYENYSFDEVWTASLKALTDIGYSVKESYREMGMIFAQGNPNPSRPFIEQEKPPNMNITTSEENGRIKLDCQVVVSTALVDAIEIRKVDMNLFLEALNKNLNK